jgi:DNA-binding transcriptional MocR family regulator
MPEGDANELAQIALRHGVSIVPGSLVSPRGGFADYVRLPLVPDPAFLQKAMERLGRAWNAYRKGTLRAPKRGVGVIV